MFLRNLLSQSLLLLILITTSCSSFASIIDANEYDYPYANDSLLATISSALMKEDEIANYPYDIFVLHPIPERKNTPIVGSRSGLRVRFYSQDKKAPLMILLAGLGGHASTGYLKYYADQFYQAGFHVLTLPSPYHWSFTLSASTSGYPGVSKEDAQDLYKVIQLALATIEEDEPKAIIEKIGFMSVSMGALEGAYLADLDQAEKKVNIDKFLLINPPVNSIYGSTMLDTMFGLSARELGRSNLKNLQERIFNFGYKIFTSAKVTDPEYFLNLDKRFPLNEVEKKFLVGYSLREPLADTILASQQIFDIGVLQQPFTWFNRNMRSRETKSFGFTDYMTKFVLPSVNHIRGETLSLEDLAKETDFTEELAAKMSENQKVFLMHNNDDFLVTDADKELLMKSFGDERSTLYPSGGHLGNLWLDRNRTDILNTFSDFFEK